jgi:hypothetical protein
MNVAIRRYQAAVELEAARDTLRVAVRTGRVRPTDYRRVKTADTVWSQLRRAAA